MVVRKASCCKMKEIGVAHCRGRASPDSPEVGFAAAMMADDNPVGPAAQECPP